MKKGGVSSPLNQIARRVYRPSSNAYDGSGKNQTLLNINEDDTTSYTRGYQLVIAEPKHRAEEIRTR
jgi:hypothetical protein